MTRLIIVLLLIALPMIAFGQKAEPAVAKYAENGKLISVANLLALKECSIRTAVGKVARSRVDGDRASVHLKDKKVETKIEIPLGRLLEEDRKALISDVLKKKMLLRIGGYACGAADAITAFSVDRVY